MRQDPPRNLIIGPLDVGHFKVYCSRLTGMFHFAKLAYEELNSITKAKIVDGLNLDVCRIFSDLRGVLLLDSFDCSNIQGGSGN